MKITTCGSGDDRGELAQRLAHQPGLQAHVAVAHVALDLGLGGQGSDRVDHDQIDGAGADQGVDDLQRLLAAVGLRHQQVVERHAEATRILGVEGVLGVNEGADAAGALGLRDGVQASGWSCPTTPARRSR
jgi:hypothetical protein